MHKLMVWGMAALAILALLYWHSESFSSQDRQLVTKFPEFENSLQVASHPPLARVARYRLSVLLIPIARLTLQQSEALLVNGKPSVRVDMIAEPSSWLAPMVKFVMRESSYIDISSMQTSASEVSTEETEVLDEKRILYDYGQHRAQVWESKLSYSDGPEQFTWNYAVPNDIRHIGDLLFELSTVKSSKVLRVSEDKGMLEIPVQKLGSKQEVWKGKSLEVNQLALKTKGLSEPLLAEVSEPDHLLFKIEGKLGPVPIKVSLLDVIDSPK